MQAADAGMLQALAQAAGIGGLALGVMLLIFRSVIAKKIFPRLDKQDAFRLLRLIIVFAWSIGVLGIVVYAMQKSKRGSPQQILEDFEKSLLTVPKEAVNRNKGLLTVPNAGLFRILPRGKYDGQMRMAGGGSYYSFSRKTGEYGYGSDLELENGSFRSGFAGLDYGLFLYLGDIKLGEFDGATAEPPGWVPGGKQAAWRFLWTFIPAKRELEIRSEQGRARGWDVQGTALTDTVSAAPNTTYLLRSFNFGRSDVLVAIRVDELMDDGSVVVAWKLLKQFDTPAVMPKGS